MKSQMVDMVALQDPWTEQGLTIPKHLRNALKNLMQASDEPETRMAWMEHIANAGVCPHCDAPLGMVVRSSGPRLQCSANAEHLEWPKA
jgi:hypothetical protein